MAKSILGYVERQGMLHRINGTAKLTLVTALIAAAMITFDARLLLALSVLNIVFWRASKIKMADLKLVLTIIGIFIMLNNFLIYLFAPSYGTEIFHSTTVIWEGVGRWNLTWEQLMYQGLVTLKYFAVLPSILLFITTTKPPEFAASLNSIGVPYRFAYAVSLTLRYIPDIQRDYRTIATASQARGLDMSAKAPLRVRIRNLMAVLMPLLLGSLERIETTSAAMELRGFGSRKRRTWFAKRPMKSADWGIVVLSIIVLGLTIVLYIVNKGRFWNPF